MFSRRLQHLARASEAHPRAFAAGVDELTDLACDTSVELFGRQVSRSDGLGPRFTGT